MTKRNDGLHNPLSERGSAEDWSKESRTAVPDNVGSLAINVEREIVEYLRAHHGVEPDEITDESTLVDLGLDSLAVFAIGDILQSKYGISIDDERVAGVRTFSEFKAFIFMNRAKRPSAQQPG